uniref:Uncharacterized protein n=1 Tax=Oryza glumipatula TaxID=40148 RepID=A0A0E0BQL9_9ORYZ
MLLAAVVLVKHEDLKRNGDIVSLFRRHEAKAKRIATFPDPVDEEAKIKEEESPSVEAAPREFWSVEQERPVKNSWSRHCGMQVGVIYYKYLRIERPNAIT